MPVNVKLPGLQEREYKISRFSPALERDRNREMTVEIDVPNVENRLLPGMTGEVKMPLLETAPSSLIVPFSCLVRRDFPVGQRGEMARNDVVYIVRDGKAYQNSVSFGLNDGQNMEITKGIQPSDLIITNPAKLKNGTPVKIEKES
jgi:hypothetical protein